MNPTVSPNPESGRLSRGKLMFLVILLALLVMGCSFITVLNKADKPVRVVINMPGSRGMVVTTIQSGGVKSVTGKLGGNFYVVVLQENKLANDLTDMKNRLLLELSNPDLTPDQTQKIEADIKTLRVKIKEATDYAGKKAPACNGLVADYGQVDGTIDTTAEDKLVISCTVNNPKVIDISPGE